MEWLKVRAAAVRADLDPKVVYKAIHNGKLKAARVGAGRNFRIADVWVDAWLEREAERPTTRGLVAVPSRRLG